MNGGVNEASFMFNKFVIVKQAFCMLALAAPVS